ncbi:hypothetical protein GHT06_020866 [Daphnia sinensis]|uniref:Uncharacterized protein n=1 Tax=Daphnia sinensis TaxID=1820382 RepID=A0AAD5L0B1_9CRUS|nr:hypothetical protein GHT06_020866 [Daphnia sinensis]
MGRTCLHPQCLPVSHPNADVALGYIKSALSMDRGTISSSTSIKSNPHCTRKMKVLMVSCLMAVAVIVQIQATGYEAKPYPSPAYSAAHSADKSSEEQKGEAYSFGYHIKDDPTYNLFGQQEQSDGKVVSGSYYVNLPDGRHQTVNYKDDGHGYEADVKYESPKYRPSVPVYNKYKREVKYNEDAPSYPDPFTTPRHLPIVLLQPTPHIPPTPNIISKNQQRLHF